MCFKKTNNVPNKCSLIDSYNWKIHDFIDSKNGQYNLILFAIFNRDNIMS